MNFLFYVDIYGRFVRGQYGRVWTYVLHGLIRGRSGMDKSRDSVHNWPGVLGMLKISWNMLPIFFGPCLLW